MSTGMIVVYTQVGTTHLTYRYIQYDVCRSRRDEAAAELRELEKV